MSDDLKKLCGEIADINAKIADGVDPVEAWGTVGDWNGDLPSDREEARRLGFMFYRPVEVDEGEEAHCEPDGRLSRRFVDSNAWIVRIYRPDCTEDCRG